MRLEIQVRLDTTVLFVSLVYTVKICLIEQTNFTSVQLIDCEVLCWLSLAIQHCK